MKRREFIAVSASSVAGGMLVPFDLLNAAACPPPNVNVTGGSSASNTTCGSTGFNWTALGPNDLYMKQSYTTQAGYTVWVRANMWGVGRNGYTDDWIFQVKDPTNWQVGSSFFNGDGTPKGYPNSCRGWSRSESATNAPMGGLGIRLDQLTKAKVHATVFMTNNSAQGYRNTVLHDIYLHSLANPGYDEGANAANKSVINILYYQRVVDPRSLSFFGRKAQEGFDLTAGGATYRVNVNPTHPDSTRVGIYIFAGPFDNDSSGLPENFGSDSHTMDLKAVLDALRVHPNTSQYFNDWNALYLTSLQCGYEPIATVGGNTVKYGITNWWTAVQNETDGFF